MPTWYLKPMMWYSPMWSVVTCGDAILARVVWDSVPVSAEGDVDMVLKVDDVALACVVRGHRRRRSTRLCVPGSHCSLRGRQRRHGT